MTYPADYQSPLARSVSGRLPSVASESKGSGATAEPLDGTIDPGAIVTSIARAVAADRCALIATDDRDQPSLIQPIYEDGRASTGVLDPGSGWEHLAARLGWPDAEATLLEVDGARVGCLIVDGHSPDRRVLTALTPIAAALIALARDNSAVRAQSRRTARRAQVGADLVSVVSHEIRSPLTSIIGALQSLRRLAPVPEGSDAEKIVTSALDRADRLHTLVDDLLVALRPERAHRLQRSRPIDVGTLVRDAVDAVPGAPETVHVVAPDPPVTATLDADRVHRILVNLIDNAIQHGASPVEVAASTVNETVSVTITDHGGGLDQEVAALLAAPTNVEGLEPVGSGLGLTITRGLVDAVDGTLQYSETPGGGATFTVLIPPGPPAGAVV